MTKLEQQVTSLEISRRLKELGVKQESLFWWVQKGSYFSVNEQVKKGEPFIGDEKPPYEFPYECLGSAFTVAELGEMLPDKIGKHKNAYLLDTRRNGKNWYIRYLHVFTRICLMKEPFIEDEKTGTEADARGKMLIYLIEQKLITI